MDKYLSGLPWGAQGIIYLLSGLVVVLAVLAIPMKWLQKFGQFAWPYFNANAVTVYRVFITLGGFYLYFWVDHFTGFCLAVLGMILDRTDGAIAAALDLLGDLRYPGKTEKGKWLDPLCDKFSLLPFFCFFSFNGMMWMPAFAAMTVFEIAGTLIRPPFNVGGRWLRDAKATGVGKAKMFFQCVLLLVSVPYHLHWWEGGVWILDALLFGIAVLAALSVASKIDLHPDLNEAVDGFTGAFDHSNGAVLRALKRLGLDFSRK